MKKRKKILLIIVIIGIILLAIPVIITANNIIRIPVDIGYYDEEEERANKLIEKEIMMNELKSNLDLYSESTTTTNSTQESINVQNVEKDNEEENEVRQIINKFYKKELDEIISKIEKQEGISDNKSISNAEIELYNLILDIINNKNISNEEKDILKEVLKDNLYKIRNNGVLNEKVNSVLQ